MLIFCTEENGKRLAEHQDQAGDGMFGETPKIVEQLHSIHIVAYGVTTAQVFAALPRKTKLMYIRYLRTLNELVSITCFNSFSNIK